MLINFLIKQQGQAFYDSKMNFIDSHIKTRETEREEIIIVCQLDMHL